MKCIYSLLCLCAVFFLSCNDLMPDAEVVEEEIGIFPDYKERSPAISLR